MQELARKFLRCLIKVSGKDDLQDNIFKIVDVPIDFTVSDAGAVYEKIYKFTRDHHTDFNDYPTIGTLETAFHERMDLEAIDELNAIKAISDLQTGSGFKYLIEQNVKELNRIALNGLIKDVHAINNGEFTHKKSTLKGSFDAVNHLINNSERFFQGTTTEQTKIEVAAAAGDAWKRYEAAKSNEFANYGIMSGIAPIDMIFKGIKKKDLLLVAGAVGECKTTLALNWAYFASVHLGFNVMFVTLEQSKENVNDMYNALHAANTRIWGDALDSQGKLKFPDGLDYDHIKEGVLTEKESKFYQIVLDDIATKGSIARKNGVKLKQDYGRFEIWEPPTELSPTLLRSTVEFENKKNPIGLLVVDYPGLMVADNKHTNETSMLNEIMKKMKIMARTFNNNEGLAVICPFQINREGKKNAENKTKSGGGKGDVDPGQLEKPMYSTFHLSYANEAERSADYIIYTYLNQELRDAEQIHIGCIKNRHGKIFSPFIATSHLASRRIFYVPADDYSRQAPGEASEISI